MFVFLISILLLSAYYFLISSYHKWWKQVQPFNTGLVRDFNVMEKISIVIPARNEEAVIEKCLHSILQQTYPRTHVEILVIDDHSTDRTAEIVSQYQSAGVRLISLHEQFQAEPGTIAFKKKAIETAIKAANGNLIITTDADCTFHKDWLITIAAFHQSSKAVFIVSPVKILPDKTLLSVFQSIDFAILQGITAASVHHKFHNMCNGANLAYEKSAFYEVDGFEQIDHIASGDDMLLMQKISNRFPDAIAYLNAPEAIVETLPAPSWKAFVSQRIRWASKTGQYKDKRILMVLALVYMLNLSLFILLVGSFVFPFWFLFFGIAVCLKIFIEWFFVRNVLAYFNLNHLMKWFPLFQPLHIIYVVIAGFFGGVGGYEWKGRKVK